MSPRNFIINTLFIVILIIGGIPVIWTIGPRIEGHFFPVTENVQVEVIRTTREYKTVQFTFDKIRPCIPIDLLWFDEYNSRVEVIQIGSNSPETRPVFRGQRSRQFQVFTQEPIEKLQVFVVSNCHPLWKTIAVFYP